jgi:hypothetical protein
MVLSYVELVSQDVSGMLHVLLMAMYWWWWLAWVRLGRGLAPP